MSYQREKLCVSPEQTFYKRYYGGKERKIEEKKMWRNSKKKGSYKNRKSCAKAVGYIFLNEELTWQSSLSPYWTNVHHSLKPLQVSIRSRGSGF